VISLDLPDDPFDLVLCQQGLQFFLDHTAALREMRRNKMGSGLVLTYPGPLIFALLPPCASRIGIFPC
jgi:ubiquinone/menaquinone biosynthesis C-methylase UbiE